MVTWSKYRGLYLLYQPLLIVISDSGCICINHLIVVSDFQILVIQLPKTFECNTCGDKHQRFIKSKCTGIVGSDPEDKNSVTCVQSHISMQILNELKSLSGRMSAMSQEGRKARSSCYIQ